MALSVTATHHVGADEHDVASSIDMLDSESQAAGMCLAHLVGSGSGSAAATTPRIRGREFAMRFARALAPLLLFAPAVAFADNPPPGTPPTDPASDVTGTPNKTAPPTPTGQLPPTTSTHDEQPEVPIPSIPGIGGGVIEQAGVGGTVSFARAGVLELGGSAGLMIAQDMRDFNVSPQLGYFIVDNVEMSAILSVANIKAGAGDSSTIWSALIEPSFHVPFNRSMFGFAGVGVGAAYVDPLGTGLAVAPRIGMDFMVGRSGILRPSLSYEYTTHDAKGTMSGGTGEVTLVAISSALRVNIGYAGMW